MTPSDVYTESLARYRRILQYVEEDLTLQDIARLEAISAERVRQILAKGEPPKPPGRPSSRDEARLDQRNYGKQASTMSQVTREASEDLSLHPVAAPSIPMPEHTAAMHIRALIVPGRTALATMHPDEMRRLFFVSTFSLSDPDSPAPRQHGYQRDPMKPRLPGIARYFRTGAHQSLITPIIVSVRLKDNDEIEEFIELFNRGRIEAIHQRWHRAVVSVVDGQHRYLGLVKAHEDDPDFNPVVPVMLYFGLTYRDEADLFDTINSTQRKLPRALIEVTKGDITQVGAVTHDQMVRNIAFALVRDADSPWFGDVNMTGARDPDRPVTYEGLRRSTANMFTPEVAARLLKQDYALEEVAKDYWRLVKDACPDAWEKRPREQLDPETGKIVEVEVNYRLKELVGVASVARLGKDILVSSLEASHFHERMSELVSLLSEVDWAKEEGNPWMASQAGLAGQKDLYTMLHRLVYLGEKPGEAA